MQNKTTHELRKVISHNQEEKEKPFQKLFEATARNQDCHQPSELGVLTIVLLPFSFFFVLPGPTMLAFLFAQAKLQKGGIDAPLLYLLGDVGLIHPFQHAYVQVE